MFWCGPFFRSTLGYPHPNRDEHLAELAPRTHQAEALGRVRSKPTACDLGGIPSLQPRVPPWVRPGESEHEDIEAPSRCNLLLGRDGVLPRVVDGG